MGSSFATLLQPAERNGKIRAAREAAMAVLKPSEKDLEHALELHSKSLVVESYGFSPRSAIDGEALRRAIETGRTTWSWRICKRRCFSRAWRTTPPSSRSILTPGTRRV